MQSLYLHRKQIGFYQDMILSLRPIPLCQDSCRAHFVEKWSNRGRQASEAEKLPRHCRVALLW
jgi:hypothetical protein